MPFIVQIILPILPTAAQSAIPTNTDETVGPITDPQSLDLRPQYGHRMVSLASAFSRVGDSASLQPGKFNCPVPGEAVFEP